MLPKMELKPKATKTYSLGDVLVYGLSGALVVQILSKGTQKTGLQQVGGFVSKAAEMVVGFAPDAKPKK